VYVIRQLRVNKTFENKHVQFYAVDTNKLNDIRAQLNSTFDSGNA